MGWIAGLEPISGPRWSCGAYWAEDGNPQTTDTDWGDSTTWDTAHAYDPDAAISFGLFVGGHDVTEWLQAASWGLGQSDPLPTGVQPSSCSITLRSDVTTDPELQDRVCILTEWDVLWVGQVEAVAEAEDVERTVLELQAVDPITLAQVAEVDGVEWGGSVMSLLDTMLLFAGIRGRAWASVPDDHDPPSWPYVFTAARSGKILQLLAEALTATTMQASWSPRGLRVCTLALGYQADYPTPLQTFGELRSITRSRGLDRIVNTLYLTSTTFGDESVVRATSVAQYGTRPPGGLTLDLEGWQDPGSFYLFWWPSILDGYDGIGHATPLPMYQAEARIASRRHTAARLVPFDQVSDGDPDDGGTDERFRVMRTSHRVTVDSWDVSLEGVALWYAAP